MPPPPRLALRTAFLIEKQSLDFYRQAAGMVSSERTRSLFLTLAEDEADHLRSFQRLCLEHEFGELRSLLDLPPALDTKLYSPLLMSVERGLGEIQALSIALHEEEECMELYAGLIGGFTDPGFCSVFRHALLETRLHCRFLEAEYLRLRGEAGIRGCELRTVDACVRSHNSSPKELLTCPSRLLCGPKVIDISD